MLTAGPRRLVLLAARAGRRRNRTASGRCSRGRDIPQRVGPSPAGRPCPGVPGTPRRAQEPLLRDHPWGRMTVPPPGVSSVHRHDSAPGRGMSGRSLIQWCALNEHPPVSLQVFRSVEQSVRRTLFETRQQRDPRLLRVLKVRMNVAYVHQHSVDNQGNR